MERYYIEVARVRAIKEAATMNVSYYSEEIEDLTVSIRRVTPIDAAERIDDFAASYTLNSYDKAFMIFSCVDGCSSYGFDLTEYIVKAIKENRVITGVLRCDGYTSIREKGNPSYRCPSKLEFSITPHASKR